MKENHEILNYEEKEKFLRENGWETWYHDDNWIKSEWYEQGIQIDRAGMSTDSAYNLVNNQNKRRELIKSKIKQK
jgi:hypothetical protein